MLLRIKKGLDLPLAGRPEQAIHETRGVISAAVTFQYSDDFETKASEIKERRS